MKEQDNIVTLTDEMGREVQFEFLDLEIYRDEEYVVLLPVSDEPTEEGEVVILQIEEGDGETESYVSVEDEETLLAVFALFRKKYEGEFDFAD
ncbi:MAG: DUF1292 domain-containing protein [Clostridiales bacterium]|nr:DUF1292 domain-containing protein [Clostridiales bacterium]